MRLVSILIAVIMLAVPEISNAEYDSLDQRAFCQKIIYTETPEIGAKWRGGFRDVSLLAIDAYENIGNVLTADILFAGMPERTFYDSATGDSTTLADNVFIFSLKSRPIAIRSPRLQYKIGGGLKIYSAYAKLVNQYEAMYEPKRDGAFIFFATQSWFLPRTQRHYFNLYTSVSFRSDTLSTGKTTSWPTFYFVPGYRFYFGKTRHWSAGIEYLLMNPRQLPFKTIQYLVDPDLEFTNLDQDWVSFMFYGVSFTTRHVRVDINMANHISFTAPFVPMIGFGWGF
jgi:hypothetical protein